MKKLSKDVFSREVSSDEEFDELVSELLYVEPPTSLVDTILSSVADVPLPQVPEEGEQGLQGVEGGLVVRHNTLQPS